ncbi:MAG TPA: hypothetical protein VMT28_12470 [Terriglobales bacterium]|jgi:hypothetical protein|nr:hypothetical protein [Terriglobales bacterium]
MPVLATRSERQQGRPLTTEEIFEVTRERETALSRLVVVYITSGLFFMLLPGTFLGVWNLLAISARHAADSVTPAWIQAHGHAQIFGWIGSFILGIGFYSIPKLRRSDPFALFIPWTCWALWTTGVAMRWVSNVYQWHWRWTLPLSGALELAAFLIFFAAVSGHRAKPSDQPQRWVLVVAAASLGLLLNLLLNLGAGLYLAVRGVTPAFPPEFDQRYLVLSTWGFLVPFVWGFSAKWLPVFLGLRPVRERTLLGAAALNLLGVLAALAGWMAMTAAVLLAGMLTACVALRLFEAPQQSAKVKGVHHSFPVFVRLAYLWAMVAALLGMWAAFSPHPLGIWGASRHALTVGFLATMVFCIGQRVLPAFSGMRLLFSARLMFVGLLLLTAGCLLRVTFEILAYQGFAGWAWPWLKASAITEMGAVTIFAVNLLCTFASRPTGPAPV